MLHEIGGRIIGNCIKQASAQRYARRLIKRVNRNEEGAEVHKQKTRTGLIKVSGLRHKKENQSDPRFAWFMFYRIYRIYIDIKNN